MLNLALLEQRAQRFSECFRWCDKALRCGPRPAPAPAPGAAACAGSSGRLRHVRAVLPWPARAVTPCRCCPWAASCGPDVAGAGGRGYAGVSWAGCPHPGRSLSAERADRMRQPHQLRRGRERWRVAPAVRQGAAASTPGSAPATCSTQPAARQSRARSKARARPGAGRRRTTPRRCGAAAPRTRCWATGRRRPPTWCAPACIHARPQHSPMHEQGACTSRPVKADAQGERCEQVGASSGSLGK